MTGWLTILYPVFVLAFLFGMDIAIGRKLSEKLVVRNLLHAALWTTCFIMFKSLLIFMIGGLVLIMFTDIYLLSKLYPTSDIKYFTRRKKDAMQRPVPGAEKSSKDILENKDRDISKDH